MLVVLPTYRRVEQLRWSVESVLRAQLPPGEIPRLLVVSNSPDMHTRVADIVYSVARQCGQGPWEIELLRRPQTLPPAINWYSAIHEYARDGELVFLHGDDDIMLPWGLECRIKAMRASGADLLVTRMIEMLYFDGPDYCYGPNLPSVINTRVCPLTWNEGSLEDSLFIGDNCYRYTSAMKNAIKMAFEWCDAQTFLDITTRTAMVSKYIPLACLHTNMLVYDMDAPCEVRGTGIQEYINSPCGSRDWNISFLHMVALDIITSPPLAQYQELDRRRKEFSKWIASHYGTIYIDKKVKKEARKILQRKLRGKIQASLFAKMLSFPHVLSEWFGLRKLVIMMKCKRMRSSRSTTLSWFERVFNGVYEMQD